MEFHQALPPYEVLMDMPPEELAGHILQFIKDECSSQWHLGTPLMKIDTLAYADETHSQTQVKMRSATKLAVREAWHWLEAQGLLIPREGSNGQNGFRETSRRADAITNDHDIQRFAAATMLPKEILHTRIRTTVWSAFVRGEYENAVFQAMRALEISVREAGGYDGSARGVVLMQKAFNKDDGPLTDMSLELAEREALRNLVAGAYGYFRNPTAHRDVSLDQPEKAMEIVLLANHILSVVDAALLRNEDQ